jgi:hypothetical protein
LVGVRSYSGSVGRDLFMRAMSLLPELEALEILQDWAALH